MQREPSVPPFGDRIGTSPARHTEPKGSSGKADVSLVSPEIALALIEAQLDSLLAKIREATTTAEVISTITHRVERLETNTEEHSLVIRQRMEQLEVRMEEQSSTARQRNERLEWKEEGLRQELIEHLRNVTNGLEAIQISLRENVIRSLASLRRPAHDTNVRSVLGTLARFPPRRAWRLAKDYRLLSSSALFSRHCYLQNYPDVFEAGFDPVLHYLLFGASEGRRPGPHFDGAQYLRANPDVERAGVNPLVHFLRHGVSEGRRLRPLPLSAVGDSEKARAQGPRPVKSEPQLWYFIGDSIDWLNAHYQLTGVGRVSTELLLASLKSSAILAAVPCVLDNGTLDLVAAPPACEDLLRKIGRSESGTLNLAPLQYVTVDGSPEPGDHIFFTGLVWTPAFAELFRHLNQKGIEFSVLVHDIIPIESPELVGELANRSFSEWLATVVNTASVIFVSGYLVRDQILRWALLSGLEIKAEIIVIPFGSGYVGEALSREELASDPLTARVELGAFVLSVGTIDRRKNQLTLCKIWKDLAQNIGVHKLPQLVLAGRDDLDIAECIPDLIDLLAIGKVLILEGLPDKYVASLYRTCIFTAFPSLCEGYGLPVAESLFYGKLCVSSDLAVIREHARDLVWYFSADDPANALDVLTRAIQDPETRIAAELRIKQACRPSSWTEAYEIMAAAAERRLRSPVVEVVKGQHRQHFLGAREVAPIGTLAKIARWCVGDHPDVSILVINWNAAPLTLECIRQIWSHTEGYKYEIIIADNGSASSDLCNLRNLGSGVRLLELGCNRFFGEANNIAAEEAHGRYICILNNDAFVQPGWLTALVKGFEDNADVGAAGPLFQFPDGAIQEAGATIDARGYPVRFGRGENKVSAETLTPRFVDYISAAALLVRRDLFIEAGGFDLAYEPAYYEDSDLCFKIQALGRKILYCPDAKVIHIEGHSANHNTLAERRRIALGDLNREKFVSRWGDYLRTRDEGVLASLRRRVLPAEQPLTESPSPTPRMQLTRTAVVYTPYSLTPGGGESYLLSLATVLAARCRVTVVTPHRYSTLRLRNLGGELGIDLSGLRLLTEEEFLKESCPDLMVVMGNRILPVIKGLGKTNIYICQFPFPIEAVCVHEQRCFLDNYRAIVVYSDYVRSHVYAGLSAYRLPPKAIKVIHPPVRQMRGDATRKKNNILAVGRFFVGGHSKRHDALIETFKSMAFPFNQHVELHLAGSSTPEPEHMDYLAQLMALAHGFPIHFHVNPPSEQLQQLYQDAVIYWHGTGIGADLVLSPEKAEHFGISLVEAMSAEAIPFALSSGGPREIIDDGETGFLYETTAQLADLTLTLFAEGSEERRRRVGRAASRRALEYSREKFAREVNALIDEIQ
jgi:GT2 family glycosyltransferase